MSYVELATAADEFARSLPAKRCLVFLEAANTVAAIRAYVGCLRAGHVVHLFGKLDSAQLSDLAARYRPEVIIQQGADGLRIELARQDANTLHESLAVLLSTSGSTGSPKLVKLSRLNLGSNARAIVTYLGISPSDRAITSLNFNYSYGLSVINSYLLAGGALVLTEASVTEPKFWDAFNQHRCTSFAGVPYSFELLARSSQWAATPTLRYVTVAGGRLEPQRVGQLARLGRRHGWHLYVMYGQTEAAPRMAYLPPHLAETHPDHIGGPIPGGELLLLDINGNIIQENSFEGELAFRGPNVMMGYASHASDLASDETPALLQTGDIAVRTAPGLFKIIGRKARFVKPFGLRINLDEVEAIAREKVHSAVAAGDDDRIVIAAPALPPAECDALQTMLARRLSLPLTAVVVRSLEAVPLLASGKPDYSAITALAPHRPPRAAQSRRRVRLAQAISILASGRFYRRVAVEALVTLGFKRSDWNDVQSIFETLIGRSDVSADSSFASLGGDSMCFVQTSLALEMYLGYLPPDWELLPISALEELRNAPAAF